MIATCITLASVAGAVERLDAHGFQPTAQDGDPLDLLTVYRPQRFAPMSVTGQALVELAGRSLVLQQQHGDDVDDDVLRSGLTAVNVGLTGAVHRRVGIGLSVPYYLFEGDLPWGDVRLSLPLGVAVPGDGTGASLGVLPWIDLPTGDEYRFLGDRGTEKGAALAFGASAQRFQFSMNLGAYTAPEIAYLTLRGGPHGIAGLGSAVAIDDRSAIRVEALYEPSLYLHDTWDDWRNESPGEATLSYFRSARSGLFWVAGVAVPFTSGAGTALRAIGGVGWSYGKEKAPDADADGIPDKRDECVDQPENRNGYADRDGCPDALAEALFTVVNDDERPVPEADLSIGGFAGKTDAQGQAKVSGLFPVEPQSGVVSHPFYTETPFTVAELEAEKLNERTIRIVFVPGEVKVTAAREDGSPINARVRFVGPAKVATQYLGADGVAVFSLRPGEWRLLVSAPEFGTERHDLVVEPGGRASADVRVTLKPARAVMDVAKKEVRILEQVHFDSGRDSIQADSMPLLIQVANLLLDNPHVRKVEVQGHTDSDGDDRSNMELSQRRVENVTRALVSMGVASDRLDPKGYGETKPIADNKSAAGRALNRRVQFVIVAQDSVEGEEAPPPEAAEPPPPVIDTEGL